MIGTRCITVVLGGGRGTRLHPLTAQRAKPAVPLGGRYRLIDIPLSNAINSGLREIFVLTQFNSASLNAHLARTYRFDMFTSGFVEVLAAEQTETSGDWFQGTADAVRQHLHRFTVGGVDHVMILSGDHLYRMQYDKVIEHHMKVNADITVCTIPVEEHQCHGFGVLASDDSGRIRRFREKPEKGSDLSDLVIPESQRKRWNTNKPYMASMGVYLFKASALNKWLKDTTFTDFGRDILPRAIEEQHVSAYVFDDYWEDIGTIASFYHANLGLCGSNPTFRFYVPTAPIYSRARFLPPSVYRSALIESSLVAEGCLVFGARIVNSIIGQRSFLHEGCKVEDSIIMGADHYELDDVADAIVERGEIPIGIGKGASVKRAIIDKNARIGAGCIIHGEQGRPDEDHERWAVRDGIIIVAKDAVIPAGTVL